MAGSSGRPPLAHPLQGTPRLNPVPREADSPVEETPQRGASVLQVDTTSHYKPLGQRRLVREHWQLACRHRERLLRWPAVPDFYVAGLWWRQVCAEGGHGDARATDRDR